MDFQSKCDYQFSRFFNKKGFAKTYTPILTSSDCEAGGETFAVKGPVTKEDNGTFFKSQKYLTVSHQLELEAMAQAKEKVWSLSPTFRAEKSDTSRHLSEFYMLEAEQTHIKDKTEVMDLVEHSLRFVAQQLYHSKVGQEVILGKRSEGAGNEKEQLRLSEMLDNRFQGMMKAGWPRIAYTDAITLLESSPKSFEHRPRWENGLTSEHEHHIATVVGEGSPVFVTNYPKSIKPFYMLGSQVMPHDEGRTVENFDLLVPEVCELAGGSMRENNFETLIINMQEKGLLPLGEFTDVELGNYQDYVDLRRWGYIPSGGFGLGFNRFIMYLTGTQNIREVVLYPRSYGH